MINHARTTEEVIAVLDKRIKDLQGSRALGAIAAICESTDRPAPTAGRWIYETDTGLQARGDGTQWVYPPQLIRRASVSSSAASVTLDNIPQTFTDLTLRIAARSSGTGSSGYDTAGVQFNGVATSTYNWNAILSVQSSGTVSAGGGSGQPSTVCAHIWNSHFATDGRGIAEISIPNYSSSSGIKGLTSLTAASDGSGAGITRFYTGFCSSSAAITSIKVLMTTGSFIAAEISLYGS